MRRLDQVYHRAELRAAAYRSGEARKDLVGCGSRCGREHAVFQEPHVLAPVRRTRDVRRGDPVPRGIFRSGRASETPKDTAEPLVGEAAEHLDERLWVAHRVRPRAVAERARELVEDAATKISGLVAVFDRRRLAQSPIVRLGDLPKS